MRDITKSVISTCAGLVVIGIGMFVAGVFLSGNVGLRLDFKNRKAISNTHETVEEIKNLEKFTEMEINIPYSDVEIVEGDEYKLEYCINKDGKLQAEVSDGKLKLNYAEADEASDFTLNVFYLGDVSGSKQFKLYIPSDASIKKADITLGSGNMEINSVDIGEIKIKDEFGAVDIDDIKSDKIVIEAESGSIKGGNITADEIELIDSFGSIKIDELTSKKAKLKAESGSIKIKDFEVDDVDIKSEFGSVELSLKGQEADYSYDLDTEFGSLHVDGKKVGKEEDSDSRIKYIKDGGAKKVKAKAESGSIRIDFE